MNYFRTLMLLAVVAGGASAAQIQITAVSGSWRNAQDSQPGSSAYDPVITNGTPTSLIRWGKPDLPSLPQSGYDFTRTVPGVQTVPPAPTPNFPMGTFRHQNFPVDVTSLSSVDLDIVMSMTIDGTPIPAKTFTFKFTHDETDNNLSPCPYATPPGGKCSDRVSFVSSPQPTTFQVGGVDYTLSMSFVDSNGNNVSQIITLEDQVNTAALVGRFTVSTNNGGGDPGDNDPGPGDPGNLPGGNDSNNPFSAASTDLSGAYAYPVPWKSTSGVPITFKGLTAGTKIRIFSADGRLVQELFSPLGADVAWDVKNSDRKNVASWVYFYVLDNTHEKRKGKLVIIQ